MPVYFCLRIEASNLFSSFFLVMHGELIQEIIAIFGTEEHRIGGRKRGVHGADRCRE